MAKFSDSNSWTFHGFPDLDPDAILRQKPADKALVTEERGNVLGGFGSGVHAE